MWRSGNSPFVRRPEAPLGIQKKAEATDGPGLRETFPLIWLPLVAGQVTDMARRSSLAWFACDDAGAIRLRLPMSGQGDDDRGDYRQRCQADDPSEADGMHRWRGKGASHRGSVGGVRQF